jgi:hypothetical protein
VTRSSLARAADGSRRTARLRHAAAVAPLAAGAVAWAALPAGGAAPGLRPVLAAAAVCAVFTVATLVAAPRPRASSFQGQLAEAAGRFWASIVVVPWSPGLMVAVLGLEALHPSRPWHTAVLGVVLLSFLLALHLAETAAQASVFRPHLPFLATGLGLAALSAGAAMLPGPGAGAGWLAVLAAIAAVLAAAVALPL